MNDAASRRSNECTSSVTLRGCFVFSQVHSSYFQTSITSTVGFCFNKHPSNNTVSQALASNSTSHSKLENLYMNILKIHAAPEQSRNNHRIESPLTLQDDANR